MSETTTENKSTVSGPSSNAERQLGDLLGVIFFSILGLIILFWSASEWFELAQGERTGASFCSIDSYWNCDRATMSPLGSIGNLPIGVFGLAWFWVVGFLTLARRMKPFLIMVKLLGVLTVLVYFTYLFGVLKAGCTVCYAAYFALFGLCFFSWRFTRGRSRKGILSSRMAFFMIGMGLGGISTFAGVNVYRVQQSVSESEFHAWLQSLPKTTVPMVSPFVKGSSMPKITVVEFSDFGCPVCEKAATTLVPYLSSQPDIQVMMYPFPLDSACNPIVTRAMHANACDWAKGAYCANRQNKFWAYHDDAFRMLSSERELKPLLPELANLGLIDEEFRKCYSSPEAEESLKQAMSVATSLEIKSTPVFFVNGLRIDGAIPLPLMRRLITELRKP